MSSFLLQAVELAQAGKREEARQLLWQHLQTEPNNEVAWLWLASVAADQAEYQRALNEVLRINPNNQQAQQLLAQFQQQFGSAAPSPYAVPAQGQPAAPYTPSPAPYTPAQPPPPAPYGSAPGYGAPPAQTPSGYLTLGTPAPALRPVEVEVRTTQKRRGCLGCSMPGCLGCLGCGGCGQGCLLALFILVIAPIVLCAGLSYTNYSLGPLDWPAAYLPGKFGRKTITFTAPINNQSYSVTAQVSRSWYVADPTDKMWPTWRSVLDDAMPFDNTYQTWEKMFEVSSGQVPNIVDIDAAAMTEGGSPIWMSFYHTVTGDFKCSTVRSQHPQDEVIDYGGGLCGYRAVPDKVVDSTPAQRIFKSVDAPLKIRTVIFFVPLDQGNAAAWQIVLPDKLFDRLKNNIDNTITTLKLVRK